MTEKIINEIATPIYKQVEYGKNQKKSGDHLQNKIIHFLREHYPDSLVVKEVKVYGSEKKSKKTGKIKPKLNRVDIIWDRIVISSKNQITSGTAEQKLIYELCMIYDYMTKNENKFDEAYIVYDGTGIKIVEEEYDYIPIFKELKKQYFDKIKIISFCEFMERFKKI
jgi:hypothetical protein